MTTRSAGVRPASSRGFVAEVARQLLDGGPLPGAERAQVGSGLCHAEKVAKALGVGRSCYGWTMPALGTVAPLAISMLV